MACNRSLGDFSSRRLTPSFINLFPATARSDPILPRHFLLSPYRLPLTLPIGAALAGKYGWQRRQTRKRCKASFVILKIHLISPVS